MLYKYLIITFRHLKQHKFFFLINVFGLATGIAFCMLIFLFIKDERSFDQFHTNAERIFRVHQINLHEQARQDTKGLAGKSSGRFISKMIYLPLPLGPALKKDFPEVESFVRFKEGNTVISNGKESFKETIHFTDASFFDVFSFKLLQGKKENVLRDLTSVVITKDIATKYLVSKILLGKHSILHCKAKKRDLL